MFWMVALAHMGVGQPTSGRVFDALTLLPLPGVNVYTDDRRAGTITDANGTFRFDLPSADSVLLRFSLVGYEPAARWVISPASGQLTVLLNPGTTLQELTVRAKRLPTDSVATRLSALTLSAAQINQTPALLGEKDVLKALQLLPGVQKPTENNPGFYVRGGGPDQNLMLLDGAQIYNPNHLLGFFSAFNSSVIETATLIKGGFPARFGGRLSSVVELQTQTGPPDSLRAEASVGLLAARAKLAGPLGRRTNVAQRPTFVVAARRSYLDVVLRTLNPSYDADNAPTQTFFSDANASLNVPLGPRQSVRLSAYTSRDEYFSVQRQAGDARLGWQNRAASLRWQQTRSARQEATALVTFSQYQLAIENQQAIALRTGPAARLALRYQSSIRDIGAQYEIRQQAGAHEVRYGTQSTYHRFIPSAVVQNVAARQTATSNFIDALESGVYVDDAWAVNPRWRLTGGLRLSHYVTIGQGVLTRRLETTPGVMAPSSPDTTLTPTPPGSATSATGGRSLGSIPNYLRLEPRVAATYQWTPTLTLKASYAMMNQYVHLLSSTGVGLPADLWVPTLGRIRPQRAQQVALGVAKDLPRHGLALTLETYGKTMHDLISYTEGASFLSAGQPTNGRPTNGRPESATPWADNVTSGRGWAYGAEVLLQKTNGRLTGWVGYTLAWVQWQFADLNGGRPFFPRYDRRHDAAVVALYNLRPGLTLSAAWVYGSGNALTLPTARFRGFENVVTGGNNQRFGEGPNVREYGERNSFRAEDYHRLDLSMQFRKARKRLERTWEVGAYNVYNRQNPFYYSLEGESQGPLLPSRTVLYRYSLFSILPSVNYSLKF